MSGLDLLALVTSAAALGVSIAALAKARAPLPPTEPEPIAGAPIAAFFAEAERQGATLVTFGGHLLVAGASDVEALRRLKRAAVKEGGREAMRQAARNAKSI